MELPFLRRKLIKQTPSTPIDHYKRRTARVRKIVDKNDLGWADHQFNQRYFRSSFFSKSRIDRLALIGQQFRRATYYCNQLKKLAKQKNPSVEKAEKLVSELDRIHQSIFSKDYTHRLSQLLVSLPPEQNNPEYRYAIRMAESREILTILTKKNAKK